MDQGNVLTFVDWLRVVEVPALLALLGVFIAHMRHDSQTAERFTEALAGQGRGQDMLITAIKADYLEKLMTARSDADAAVSALQRQLSGFQIEAANTYARNADVVSHIHGVEARLSAAVADLKSDFNRRTDELLGLYRKQG